MIYIARRNDGAICQRSEPMTNQIRQFTTMMVTWDNYEVPVSRAYQKSATGWMESLMEMTYE